MNLTIFRHKTSYNYIQCRTDMIAYIAGNGKSRSDYASKKDGNQDRQQNDHAPCFRIPLFATIPGSPVLGSLSSLIFCAKEVSFAFIVVVVSDGS